MRLEVVNTPAWRRWSAALFVIHSLAALLCLRDDHWFVLCTTGLLALWSFVHCSHSHASATDSETFCANLHAEATPSSTREALLGFKKANVSLTFVGVSAVTLVTWDAQGAVTRWVSGLRKANEQDAYSMWGRWFIRGVAAIYWSWPRVACLASAAWLYMCLAPEDEATLHGHRAFAAARALRRRARAARCAHAPRVAAALARLERTLGLGLRWGEARHPYSGIYAPACLRPYCPSIVLVPPLRGAVAAAAAAAAGARRERVAAAARARVQGELRETIGADGARVRRGFSLLRCLLRLTEPLHRRGRLRRALAERDEERRDRFSAQHHAAVSFNDVVRFYGVTDGALRDRTAAIAERDAACAARDAAHRSMEHLTLQHVDNLCTVHREKERELRAEARRQYQDYGARLHAALSEKDAVHKAALLNALNRNSALFQTRLDAAQRRHAAELQECERLLEEELEGLQIDRDYLVAEAKKAREQGPASLRSQLKQGQALVAEKERTIHSLRSELAAVRNDIAAALQRAAVAERAAAAADAAAAAATAKSGVSAAAEARLQGLELLLSGAEHEKREAQTCAKTLKAQLKAANTEIQRMVAASQDVSKDHDDRCKTLLARIEGLEGQLRQYDSTWSSPMRGGSARSLDSNATPSPRRNSDPVRFTVFAKHSPMRTFTTSTATAAATPAPSSRSLSPPPTIDVPTPTRARQQQSPPRPATAAAAAAAAAFAAAAAIDGAAATVAAVAEEERHGIKCQSAAAAAAAAVGSPRHRHSPLRGRLANVAGGGADAALGGGAAAAAALLNSPHRSARKGGAAATAAAFATAAGVASEAAA